MIAKRKETITIQVSRKERCTGPGKALGRNLTGNDDDVHEHGDGEHGASG